MGKPIHIKNTIDYKIMRYMSAVQYMTTGSLCASAVWRARLVGVDGNVYLLVFLGLVSLFFAINTSKYQEV